MKDGHLLETIVDDEREWTAWARCIQDSINLLQSRAPGKKRRQVITDQTNREVARGKLTSGYV